MGQYLEEISYGAKGLQRWMEWKSCAICCTGEYGRLPDLQSSLYNGGNRLYCETQIGSTSQVDLVSQIEHTGHVYRGYGDDKPMLVYREANRNTPSVDKRLSHEVQDYTPWRYQKPPDTKKQICTLTRELIDDNYCWQTYSSK